MKYLITIISVLVLSCGKDKGSKSEAPAKPTLGLFDYGDEELAGKMAGNSWRLGAAHVRQVAPAVEGRAAAYQLRLTDEKLKDPCKLWSKGQSSEPRQASVPVKLEKGEFSFAKQNETAEVKTGVTLYYFDASSKTFMNQLTDEAGYDITVLGDSQISGRLYARYDDRNFIKGTFSAKICPVQ